MVLEGVWIGIMKQSSQKLLELIKQNWLLRKILKKMMRLHLRQRNQSLVDATPLGIQNTSLICHHIPIKLLLLLNPLAHGLTHGIT